MPPEAAIGVLVLPALPRVVRLRKIHGGLGIPLNHTPERELAPAVIGDRLIFELLSAFEGRVYRVGRTVGHEIGHGIEARMHMGEYPRPGRALYRIALPARGRSFLNRAHEPRPALFLRPLRAVSPSLAAALGQAVQQVRPRAVHPGIHGLVVEAKAVPDHLRRDERVEQGFDRVSQSLVVLKHSGTLLGAPATLPGETVGVRGMVRAVLSHVADKLSTYGRTITA